MRFLSTLILWKEVSLLSVNAAHSHRCSSTNNIPPCLPSVSLFHIPPLFSLSYILVAVEEVIDGMNTFQNVTQLSHDSL